MSWKTTRPAVTGAPPEVTLADKVKTDPAAALAGDTERVVVAVWACRFPGVRVRTGSRKKIAAAS